MPMTETLQTPLTRRPPKFQAVCARLTDLAHRLGPGEKLPTVAQLRDQLGVSVATLNTALGELEAQHILQRKHGVGIYVSERLHHRTICLVCDPSFFQAAATSPFWNMLIERSQKRAEAHQEQFSYHFSLPQSSNGEPRLAPLHEGLLREIKAGCVDGILAVGLNTPDTAWMEEQWVPFVAFAGPGPYVVGMDNARLVDIAVEQLAAQGCRRIAFWSAVSPHRTEGQPPRATVPLGVREFKAAMERHGLTFEPALVEDNCHLCREDGKPHTVTHQEQGYNTACRVFGDQKIAPPDGIVCADDMLLVGALNLLPKLGVRVGEDVRIATHGNIGSPVLLGWEDRLTIIAYDPDEVVAEMFRLLERLMEGEKPIPNFAMVRPRLLTENRAVR
jgi:DNA-binding LacI/PurR family transcriptional regulator